MARLVPQCCAKMLQALGWHNGIPGDVRTCPRCLRTWAWQEGVWWKGPKAKVET